jgi:hypothetical protein
MGVTDSGNGPSRRDQAYGVERAGHLGRERHEADGAGEPVVERREIDRPKLLDRDRAGCLRVEERALEVEAEAELAHGRVGLQRRLEKRRDALLDEPVRVVDMQVDEAGKDPNPLGDGGLSLDRGDSVSFEAKRTEIGAFDGIDEHPG